MSRQNSIDSANDPKVVQIKPSALRLAQVDGRIAIYVTEQSGLLASLNIDKADAEFLIMELGRILQTIRKQDQPERVLKAPHVIRPYRWSGGPTADGQSIVVRFESNPADCIDLIFERRYVSDLGSALIKLAGADLSLGEAPNSNEHRA